ncbi:MAG: endonuclease MutS2 [Bacilli bacterium]|nr:endonuclease MutS2 [Bacilli bacterium]
MQNIYETFEFNKIKEHLLEYAKTELAKVYIDELKMFDNAEAVKNALEDLKEVSSIIVRFGPLPIHNSANALVLIDLAKKTGLLTPRDLSLIAEDVLTIGKISTFLKKLDNMYPRVNQLTEGFIDLNNLEKEIHRVITNSLTVADNASPDLNQIRKSLKKAEATLQSKIASLAFTYGKYLNDDNITIRDGHFVLPVKTVDKSRVSGIVYDVSDSGNTTFIEPLEIVQINNEITALKVQENEEIRKILKALTALVLLQEGEIITNNKIIAKLDFLSAKAMYGNEINADIAECSNKQEVILESARHPLIDPRKVVANSYSLSEEEPIIIISGPNAGGKTVSLKTVGLLTLMHQAGLMVPVRSGKIGYFKHIFIDIGDNQSLSDNLSTFSAHISQIGEIIHAVGGKDLVLLDELGTGTDPKEGEALAVEVTKYLEEKHALAMISSHFAAMKEYAFLSKNIANASMIFDEENLSPTYRFKQGVPGKSYALEVASRYGIDSNIIKKAHEFLKQNETNDASELLDILQKKVEEANKLQDALERQQNELDRREKKLTNDEELFETRKENMMKDVKEEKEELIAKAKKEISDIISKMHNSDMKVHEVIELRKQLEELEEKEEEEVYNEEINIDDYVSIPSMNIYGKVMRLKGNKAHIVSDSGFSFDVDKSKLHKVNRPKVGTSKVKKTNYDLAINTHVGIELNLIGMHVEEASNTLMKYIDNCRLKHLSQVRIIHGFGSGALRKMTREYLDKQKDLTYRAGGEHEGGGGCTVVLFK